MDNIHSSSCWRLPCWNKKTEKIIFLDSKDEVIRLGDSRIAPHKANISVNKLIVILLLKSRFARYFAFSAMIFAITSCVLEQNNKGIGSGKK